MTANNELTGQQLHRMIIEQLSLDVSVPTISRIRRDLQWMDANVKDAKFVR